MHQHEIPISFHESRIHFVQSILFILGSIKCMGEHCGESFYVMRVKHVSSVSVLEVDLSGRYLIDEFEIFVVYARVDWSEGEE